MYALHAVELDILLPLAAPNALAQELWHHIKRHVQFVLVVDFKHVICMILMVLVLHVVALVLIAAVDHVDVHT